MSLRKVRRALADKLILWAIRLDRHRLPSSRSYDGRSVGHKEQARALRQAAAAEGRLFAFWDCKSRREATITRDQMREALQQIASSA